MSRTGLHRPRRTRPASRRPAPDTRLLHSPFPPSILYLNTHNKRCPKAQRLDLRSDQSPSRPTNGRFPDKLRQALFKGHCQVSAPPIGRNGFAPSGDAKEHGVKLLHRAIAPFSDSTVVTIGKLRSTNAGHGSPLPSLRVVEHFRWARLPQSENFSRLVHTLSEVWGKDSTVVTLGELPTTNAGHGSPLPSLRMVEHFRWARLPQSENFLHLVHVLSEVWSCRRVDAGVDRPQGRTPRIGTGVADILHKPSGTFHRLLSTNRQNGKRDRTTEQPLPHHHPHASLPSFPSGARPEKSRGNPSPWGVAGRPAPSSLGRTYQECSAFLVCQLFLWGVGSGTKGTRVSSPFLKSQNNQNPHPRATRDPQKISLGVIQSKQLRVQSMINQRSINPPPAYNVSASKPPTPP